MILSFVFKYQLSAVVLFYVLTLLQTDAFIRTSLCVKFRNREELFLKKLGNRISFQNLIILQDSSNDLEISTDRISVNNSIIKDYSGLIISLLISSFLFPYLMSNIVDPTITSNTRQYFVLGILLLKRVILYSITYFTLSLAAQRSNTVSSQSSLLLGEVILYFIM